MVDQWLARLVLHGLQAGTQFGTGSPLGFSRSTMHFHETFYGFHLAALELVELGTIDFERLSSEIHERTTAFAAAQQQHASRARKLKFGFRTAFGTLEMNLGHVPNVAHFYLWLAMSKRFSTAAEQPTAPLGLEGVHFLTSPSTRQLLATLRPLAQDPLKVSTMLAKTCSAEQRRWLMDYLQLQPKLETRFGLGDQMVCDRLAYEQSTARDLSEWKAALWPADSSLHDLCCGMGGDSFFVPQSIRVQGFDFDPARVAMYNHNLVVAGHERTAMVDDVRQLASRADFFCIDPARRSKLGDNQRQIQEMQPSWSEICQLSSRYGGGMLKLPPGYPVEELPAECEYLFVGATKDCRECLVLVGSLATVPGRVRAIALGGAGQCWSGTRQNSPLPSGEPGRFLLEPWPVLIRSHLFTALAEQASLWTLDPRIAYLTGDKLPDNLTGFDAFEIIDQVPLATRKVQEMLRRHGIGQLTLKKRGVEVVPEEEIRRLSPKGPHAGILFYTRIADRKVAMLARKFVNP